MTMLDRARRAMLRVRRKRLVLTTLAAAALLLTVCALALWRQRSFDDAWAKVHFGMSKDEVRWLVGDPDQIYAAQQLQADTKLRTIVANFLFDSTYERWAYGRRRFIASQPTFPYFSLAFDGFLGPDKQDHVIYFCDDGTVLKKRLPKAAP
jgi:hypothetical protein